MDIKSNADYPAGALTNFAENEFVFDGIKCSSMEGLIQSLKIKDPLIQTEICRLIGKKAKKKGREYDKVWKAEQKLWWRGREYDRHGPDYQELLDRAYDALFSQSERFRKALLDTGDEVLTHSIGNPNPRETTLTEEELCSRLVRLRSLLFRKE